MAPKLLPHKGSCPDAGEQEVCVSISLDCFLIKACTLKCNHWLSTVWYLQVEEDRYKEMLDRSDSENIASSYFKSKRASQLLGGDAAKGHGETRNNARNKDRVS